MLPILAALFLSASGQSAEPVPVRTLQAATAGPSRVAIWRAEDADTTLYLMGTIHILPPGTEWRNTAFETAWAASDTLILEADFLSPAGIAGARAAVDEQGFLAPPRTLGSFFGAEEHALLDRRLAPLGLSVQALGAMRPWLAGITVTQAALGAVGAEPEAGLEYRLTLRAGADGKDIRYLEATEEQIALLASEPDADQARLLADGIDKLTDIEAHFAEIVAPWYRGDADALAAVVQTGLAIAPGTEERLIRARNQAWAETIGTLLDEEAGVFFVAVGAGHLGGEGSLQQALGQRGIPVTRFRPVGIW